MKLVIEIDLEQNPAAGVVTKLLRDMINGTFDEAPGLADIRNIMDNPKNNPEKDATYVTMCEVATPDKNKSQGRMVVMRAPYDTTLYALDESKRTGRPTTVSEKSYRP